MKTCSRCLNVKNDDQFYGHSKRCKKCVNEQRTERRSLGVSDRFTNMLSKAKTRAVVAIDIQHLRDLYEKQGGRCAVTGLPFDFTKGGKNQTMSVDRIEQSKGYEPGNIRLVWSRVNFFRGQMTDQEMLTICQAICRGRIKKNVESTTD